MPADHQTERSCLLFVYGTLRRGGTSHGLLRGARFRGVVTLRGTLFNAGDYPALVVGPEGRVEGELWLCRPETLGLLDSYEGVGEGLFDRVPVRVGEEEAWTYVAGPRLLPLLRGAPVIASGRWPADTGATPRPSAS